MLAGGESAAYERRLRPYGAGGARGRPAAVLMPPWGVTYATQGPGDSPALYVCLRDRQLQGGGVADEGYVPEHDTAELDFAQQPEAPYN